VEVNRGTGGFVSVPSRSGGNWPNYAAAADVILGKAVDRPIYQILGGTKDRMLAYASSQHLSCVEAYVPDVLKAKEQGYKGYKIHPGGGQHKDGPPIPSYVGHMEEIKELRKAAAEKFPARSEAAGTEERAVCAFTCRTPS
jgi:L-alanine-DL-glutamate epimerase-like enolase superfamily enzyme